MMDNRYGKINLLLLKVAAVAVMWGYGWLSLEGKIPVSAFFWNQELLGALLPVPWEIWITDYANSPFLTHFSTFLGILLISCGLAVLFSRWLAGWAKWAAFTGSGIIIGIAILFGIEKIFFAVQFAEYLLQMSSPIFWWAALRNRQMIRYMKAAAGITFAAHGLYALGAFPRPGHFIEMTMSILNVEEAGAILFLSIAGWLDLLVAVLVWVPRVKIQVAALAYMVFWGFLTTAARWVAHVHLDLPWWPESLLAWTPEVLLRWPHFLIPLVLWRTLKPNR